MVVINIDTSKDSKEDIKQTIKYLQSLVGESSSSFSSSSSTGFMNPFAPDEPEPSSSNEFSSMMGMFGDSSDDSSSMVEASEKTDAESLLAASDEYVNIDVDRDTEVEVVNDDDGETFIEIVEYE